ncbi:MAG: fused MFS/spermidine synthase [Verrucomicrobiales bacterium]|nr:fused MFS/spermidine synthase [Verrucomicrobiales bacterium]
MHCALLRTGLYSVFMLSGAAGLAYQAVWSRLLANGLGHEMPAVLAIIATFFAGLSAGGWTLDRALARSPQPGRWYAGLEMLIGLWGALSVFLIPLANQHALQFVGVHAAGLRHWTFAFALSMAALLPATFAMGATWPAMERFAVPFATDRKVVGALYAANTLGAVVGVCAATFVLMPAFGFTRTLLIFAGVNVFCGTVAAWLAKRNAPAKPSPVPLDVKSAELGAADMSPHELRSPRCMKMNPAPSPSPLPVGRGEGGLRPGEGHFRSRRRTRPDQTQGEGRLGRSARSESAVGLRVIVFFTGLFGIGYEVVGVRVLAQVLENTIYTFASALAVFLCGTAAGAGLFQRFLRRADRDPTRSWLLLSNGAACLGGLLALSKAHVVYEAARSALPESLLAAIGAEVLTAGVVFLAPTMLMGALFSHLIQSASDLEGRVGRVTAINTVGSALAPVLFGIGLIPALGPAWAIKIIVAGYIAIATPALARRYAKRVAAGVSGANSPRFSAELSASLPRRLRAATPISQLLVAALILAAALFAPSMLQQTQPPPGGKLLKYRPGVMDSVAVVQHADGNRSLLVNNRFTMGGTGAAMAERRHAHIPLLLHPQPKRALFLGLGTGITFAASGAYPDLHADGVELVPEVVEVLPHFEPENAMAEFGQRFQIHVADARRFVRVTKTKYDVIVADLFHPARDGAGTLYTREHFQTIRARLATNGLFCQWLPLYQLDEPTFKVITKTFLDVFPNATAWLLRFNVDTPVIGLIAGLAAEGYSVDYFEDRIPRESPLTDRTDAAQLRNGFELLGCFLANADELRRFADESAIGTDDHPVVVFAGPRLNYQRQIPPYVRLLALLNRFHSDSDSLLVSSPAGLPITDGRFAEDLKQFRAARDLYLRGLMDEAEGRSDKALEKFLESAAESEHFTMAYARCLTLATQQIKENPAGARTILERLDKAQPNRPVARQLLDRLGPN